MERRLPVVTDIPSDCTLTITPPPTGHSPRNVVILLHGLGDTHEPFTNLARQLNLPHTVGISLRAPTQLPLLENGYHWGEDIVFDPSSPNLDPDVGLSASTRMLTNKVIQQMLIETCGYRARDIVLLGLGQGGMVALNTAVDYRAQLGGVVSFGGPLPSEAQGSSSPLCPTPIIVCAGVDGSIMTPSAEDKLKRNFEQVRVSRYRRTSDGMPRNRDEMFPVMQFLSTRLQMPAPIGTQEI